MPRLNFQRVRWTHKLGIFFLGLFLVLGVARGWEKSFTSKPNDRVVEVRENQLVIDGVSQPQLFGAELQYFRLRGGYGPNQPREKVLALWNKALNRLVAAKMNAISFYIPWDFHEYQEGKFDFDGTVDEDHDGRPDYPSRDLKTFFQLVKNHGISRIMVRPGPYINAEWGFLGFGAIPSWFHEKYPDSHMRTPFGLKSRLYKYHDKNLLKHTAIWFKALNDQILKDHMGPGQPVVFLQLDNETNYQWQSIYNHDFHQNTIHRYQEFLKERYKDIESLNRKHGRQWDRFTQVQPPMAAWRNVLEDQDWYRFSDLNIYSYLYKVRKIWEGLGVLEPGTLFSLAESYNAPENGLLPDFHLRNAKDVTGLMTVNLYPKTAEDQYHPLLNQPFKADLDVKSADEASDSYFGNRQEWVMGPEIQGGWWRGIDVSPEARQQTYLTVIGHGLKAFFVYYFNEGQNWDVEWSYEKIKPHFDGLLRERNLENSPHDLLPESFWNELQARSDRRILVGFDVRRIMKQGPLADTELYFDAPLDGKAKPRKHYWDLKRIGERVISPYQEFLGRSLEVQDDVAFVKDNEQHVPFNRNIPSVQASADWSGGLLGYLMNADVNPRILFGDLSPGESFDAPKVFVHLDTGNNEPRTLEILKNALEKKKLVINFLASALPEFLKIPILEKTLFTRGSEPQFRTLTYYLDSKGRLQTKGNPEAQAKEFISRNPIYSFELNASKALDCEGVLYDEDNVVGYRCLVSGGTFVQIGALIFEDFNSSLYGEMIDSRERKMFLKSLLAEGGTVPQLQLSNNADRVVAFARKDPLKKLLWITVKTGSPKGQTVSLKVHETLLKTSLEGEVWKTSLGDQKVSISDLLGKKKWVKNASEINETGFSFELPPNGSTVFVLKTD